MFGEKFTVHAVTRVADEVFRSTGTGDTVEGAVRDAVSSGLYASAQVAAQLKAFGSANFPYTVFTLAGWAEWYEQAVLDERANTLGIGAGSPIFEAVAHCVDQGVYPLTEAEKVLVANECITRMQARLGMFDEPRAAVVDFIENNWADADVYRALSGYTAVAVDERRRAAFELEHPGL